MSDIRIYSKRFIAEFIELYKSLPCLWKVKSKDYSDRNKKNAAYEKMTEKLKEIEPSADRDSVTRKINSLRSSYRKEKKKVTDSMKPGSSTEDVYVPNLWYYNLLQFVDDQETPTVPISNFEETLFELQEDTAVVHAERERRLDEVSAIRESFSTATDERLSKRRRLQEDTAGTNKGEQCMDDTHRLLKNIADKSTPDQSSLYADLLATKLRRLDYKTRQYAMLHIDNFLFTLTHGSFQLSHNSTQFGIPPLPHPFPILSNVQQNTAQGANSFPSPSSSSQPSPGFNQHESSNSAVQSDFTSNYTSDPLSTNDPTMKIEET